MEALTNNAGFFPKDSQSIEKYCRLVLDLWGETDLLCIMNSRGEGYIVQEFCKKTALTRIEVVDPLVSGWTDILKGKKILVVHPFAETIKSQYENKRQQIFPGTEILPEFDLHILKAVQTIAGTIDPRFPTWFDALTYMTDECLKIDFDIALIGCGAYGLPLAANLKRAGKKAVHMGGCLQLLFGIRGARWDSRPEYLKMVNDAWVRPSMQDIPEKAKNVESGCYW